MDVQRYIRDLNVRHLKKDDSIDRMVLKVEGESTIYAFSEFGVVRETTEKTEGMYAISFIARNNIVRGKGVGYLMLDQTLHCLKDDAANNNRTPKVVTQINPGNAASVSLFSSYGFKDMGQDQELPEYHIWMLKFKPESFEDKPYLFEPITLD